MKAFYTILLLLFTVLLLNAQQDTIGKTRYSLDFDFETGVYISFDEFKANDPSVRTFRIGSKGNYSNGLVLEAPCADEEGKWCVITDCWGYCDNGNVYISQGYVSHYFRLQVIGALIHYIGFDGYDFNYNDGYYGGYDYYMPTSSTPKFTEFFIDFETGETYLFSYKVFRDFLEVKDAELYEELMNSKRKRKLFTHFLFKYNTKHPIYF